MNDRIALYSSSLYAVSAEGNCTKEVYESLKAVREILEENSEYVKIVSSANLSATEREALISHAFEGRVDEYTLNFMKLLAKKRIFDVFVPCAREFEKQYLKENNIVIATITTAVELTDAKRRDVIEKIVKSTGKTVDAEFVVNKDIIGGIIIETENSAIDASVTGKLKNIQRHIGKN